MSEALPSQNQPLKTVGQTVWIEDEAVIIKYSMLYYGFLGQKHVPVDNIKTVTWREPGAVLAGFLEFSILGETPPSPMASPNVQHQNRFIYDQRDIQRWRTLKQWIESRIAKRGNAGSASVADELSKLADLLREGLLTREEFEAQKAKLLD